jgi:hypothetical protein
VWRKSRSLRAAFSVLLLSICTAATTCPQSAPGFSHFEAHSDRLIPEVPVRNCIERAPNVGFFGVNDVAFSIADVGLLKADFGQLDNPAGGCERDLPGVPVMSVPQSTPERRNPCPHLSLAAGVSHGLGCARTTAADETLDSVAEELSLSGKAGTRIAQVRAEVLYILSSENPCSAWFATKETAPAATFRSLSYFIDWLGPQDISQWEPEPLTFIWRQPYVARTTQDSGSYSEILINANGAFFQTLGKVEKVSREGSPEHTGEARLLLVGPYAGNTPQAQIVTLLHEFGHIIDLLPPDADNLDGKSVRNTDEVLQYCKMEIEAGSKHLRQIAKK